jgi:hypothetical protein
MKLAWVLGIAVSGLAQPPPRDFGEAQQFLGKYCGACHGKAPTGGFALDRVKEPSSFLKETHSWQRLMARIEAGDMPPKNMPSPNEAAREGFNKWVKDSLHREACAGGIRIGPRPIRRLNREEYTATVQQLLDIHMDIGANLPADGAGGEGFDNAAETLFLSPLHAEKYLETARLAMDFAAKEYKSRARILVAKPDANTTPQAAARKILTNFLPKAFRRPVSELELAPYLSLYTQARAQGDDFEPAVFFMLRAVLVSPQFLFRQEPAPYALASRLSYFLWGSQPNELLMDLARRGDLAKPEVLRALIPRMLRDDRSHVFSKRFVEQWLHTRDLDGDKAPDAKLYPEFTRNEDLRGDIRLQPVYFFREMLNRDLPITSLIDSDGTIATSHLAKHFGMTLPLNRNANTQPQWVELPKNSGRGGILGMPAVLSVASYPYRTSPVLRGAFILDAILGTPPPAPPPNVPPLEEAAPGAAPKTVRERLSQHRANPSCAGCHSRIDPLGFALENYDPIGRWRDEESGKPVDNSAEMPDGHKFAGPQELRRVLLGKQDLFLRNIASKLLGYALGRGLTLYDQCAVDAIVEEVKNNNYSSRRLVEAIVLSPPFLGELKP